VNVVATQHLPQRVGEPVSGVSKIWNRLGLDVAERVYHDSDERVPATPRRRNSGG